MVPKVLVNKLTPMVRGFANNRLLLFSFLMIVVFAVFQYLTTYAALSSKDLLESLSRQNKILVLNDWIIEAYRCPNHTETIKKCEKVIGELRSTFSNDREVSELVKNSKGNRFVARTVLPRNELTSQFLEQEAFVSLIIPESYQVWTKLKYGPKNGPYYQHLRGTSGVVSEFSFSNSAGHDYLHASSEIILEFSIENQDTFGPIQHSIALIASNFLKPYLTLITSTENYFRMESSILGLMTLLAWLVYLRKRTGIYKEAMVVCLLVLFRAMVSHLIDSSNLQSMFSQSFLGFYIFFHLVVSLLFVRFCLKNCLTSPYLKKLNFFGHREILFFALIGLIGVWTLTYLNFSAAARFSWESTIYLNLFCSFFCTIIMIMEFYSILFGNKNIQRSLSNKKTSLLQTIRASLYLYDRFLLVNITILTLVSCSFFLLNFELINEHGKSSQVFSNILLFGGIQLVVITSVFREFWIARSLGNVSTIFDESALTTLKNNEFSSNIALLDPFRSYCLQLGFSLVEELSSKFFFLDKNNSEILFPIKFGATAIEAESYGSHLGNSYQHLTGSSSQVIQKGSNFFALPLYRQNNTLQINLKKGRFPILSLTFPLDDSTQIEDEDAEIIEKFAKQKSEQLENIAAKLERFMTVPQNSSEVTSLPALFYVKKDFNVSYSIPFFVADVRSFSEIFHAASPAEVGKKINDLFCYFIDRMVKEKLDIIGPIGDALISYGPVLRPLSCHVMFDSTLRAFEELTFFQSSDDAKPLDFGIAFNFGESSIIYSGGNLRGTLNILSDALNMATRIEKASKIFGVKALASHDYVSQIGIEAQDALDKGYTRFYSRFLGNYFFKGSATKIGIYEVCNFNEVSMDCKDSASFMVSIEESENGRLDLALKHMDDHLSRFPHDKVADKIKSRLQFSTNKEVVDKEWYYKLNM